MLFEAYTYLTKHGLMQDFLNITLNIIICIILFLETLKILHILHGTDRKFNRNIARVAPLERLGYPDFPLVRPASHG